jgi:hypothetical protein
LPADATAKAAPSISMQALTATVPGAILQQVHDWPGEWGKKRLGFEKRASAPEPTWRENSGPT